MTEPDCPAPPCMDLAEFMEWCKANKEIIALLYAIWHEPSSWQLGFFSRSHIVAADANDVPLQCAMCVWYEPYAMANIEEFLQKLRGYVGIA